MGASFAGDAVTINNTGGNTTLDQCVTAVGNTALMDRVWTAPKCYFMDDVKFQINASATAVLKEEDAFLHHEKTIDAWVTGLDRTVEYATGTVGRMEWGLVDNSDIFNPIVTGDCWYFYDNQFTPGNVFWSNQTFGNGTDGDWRFYGGCFDFAPRGSTTAGQFMYMPQTRCDMVCQNVMVDKDFGELIILQEIGFVKVVLTQLRVQTPALMDILLVVYQQ